MSEKIKYNENQFYSPDPFLDPIWLKYRSNIDSVKSFLSVPKTEAGEKLCKDIWKNSVFREYNRLQPIFAGLISLVEIENILKGNNKEFTKNPLDQIIILKAFKILIEDTLKDDYDYYTEKKGFTDYQFFFESIIDDLNRLEKNIKNKIRYSDLINTLFAIFIEEVNKLPEANNFRISIKKIRKKIARYIPHLNNIDEINLKNNIQKLWEEAFSEKFNINPKEQDKEI